MDSPLPRPRPLAGIPADLCRRLGYLFTDIDDTLTTNGLLPEASFSSIWDLTRAGIQVVPVTGRPAGWCDHIARMWPVAAVIGENGAFYYSYDHAKKTMRRRYAVAQEDLAADREKLARIARRVLEEVPGTAIAADQPFRISDCAIDFCEDVPALGDESIDRICRILSSEGVRWRVSSIHVNFWARDFDKMSCLRLFLEERETRSLSELGESIAFIGDSPNDEPLFEGVPHTIAVGNIRRFIARITHLPEYIAVGDSADGFSESVQLILAKRLS